MADNSTTGLRHLLDFARADIREFSFADVRQTRRIIAVIAAHTGQYSKQKRRVFNNVKVWLPQIEDDLPSQTCTYKQLETLQSILNEQLEALFPTGGFGTLPGGSHELSVRVERLHIQRQNAGSDAPVEMFFIAHRWRDAFWLSTAALLEEFGSQIRRCPVCGEVFLKNRRQAYCSTRCSNRKRQRDIRTHRKQRLKAPRRKRQMRTQ